MFHPQYNRSADVRHENAQVAFVTSGLCDSSTGKGLSSHFETVLKVASK